MCSVGMIFIYERVSLLCLAKRPPSHRDHLHNTHNSYTNCWNCFQRVYIQEEEDLTEELKVETGKCVDLWEFTLNQQ